MPDESLIEKLRIVANSPRGAECGVTMPECEAPKKPKRTPTAEAFIHVTVRISGYGCFSARRSARVIGLDIPTPGATHVPPYPRRRAETSRLKLSYLGVATSFSDNITV